MASPERASSSAATLHDGVRAMPARGTVELERGDLRFRASDGSEQSWPLTAVAHMQRAGRSLQIDIATAEAATATDVHARLTCEDLTFEAAIIEAARRFGGGPGIGRASRRIGLLGWILITAAIVPLGWLAYTALLPKAHVFISRDTERALGDAVYDQLASGDWSVIEDAELAALLDQMVDELADPEADFDIRVAVIDDATPNAFAAPGGRIVIFSGLLEHCESADALAGVLAHEIGHVEERHSLKHLLRSVGVFAFAGAFVGGGIEEFATAEAIAEMSSILAIFKHSRAHEREADSVAVAKLRAAGRSTAGLAAFFTAIQNDATAALEQNLAWLSTHPTTAERIATLRRAAATDDPSRPQSWLEAAAWTTLRRRLLDRTK